MEIYTKQEKNVFRVRQQFTARMRKTYNMSEKARLDNKHYFVRDLTSDEIPLVVAFNSDYTQVDRIHNFEHEDIKSEDIKQILVGNNKHLNARRVSVERKKTVGWGYHKLQRYTITEVHDLIQEGLDKKLKTVEVNGFQVKVNSGRYHNFMKHGTKCVECGLEGSHYWLESNNRDKDGNPSGYHFNLYAENGVMLTKDHIIPKAKGGKNYIGNYQPMCGPCNMRKKDTMPEGVGVTNVKK